MTMEDVREYELRMQKDTNSRVLNNMESLDEQQQDLPETSATAATAS